MTCSAWLNSRPATSTRPTSGTVTVPSSATRTLLVRGLSSSTPVAIVISTTSPGYRTALLPTVRARHDRSTFCRLETRGAMNSFGRLCAEYNWPRLHPVPARIARTRQPAAHIRGFGKWLGSRYGHRSACLVEHRVGHGSEKSPVTARQSLQEMRASEERRSVSSLNIHPLRRLGTGREARRSTGRIVVPGIVDRDGDGDGGRNDQTEQDRVRKEQVANRLLTPLDPVGRYQ